MHPTQKVGYKMQTTNNFDNYQLSQFIKSYIPNSLLSITCKYYTVKLTSIVVY